MKTAALCIAAATLAGCVYPNVLPGVADQARADCEPHGGLSYFSVWEMHGLGSRGARSQRYDATCSNGTAIARIYSESK